MLAFHDRRRICGHLVLGAAAVLLPGCSSSESDTNRTLDEARAEISTRTFECGFERCHAYRDYCLVLHTGPDPLGETNVRYTCVTLPSTCAADPHCACLAEATCTENDGTLVVER